MNIPKYIKFLLAHYVVGIILFFLFRVLLYLTFTAEHGTNVINESESDLLIKSFLIGIQYDSVIMGYILALPTLILSVLYFIKPKANIYKYLNLFIYLLIFIAFYFSSADIPYFNFNFARISAVVFEQTKNASTTFKMIIEEPRFAIYILVWFISFALYVYSLSKITKKIIQQSERNSNKLTKISFSFLALLLVFFAIRGRIDSPIRINHSFFCNNSFYNQLGLNPTFVLIKSYLQDQSIKIIDDAEALKNVQQQLGIQQELDDISPLARVIQSNGTPRKKNVVLVLMESMSANKLSRYGNKDNLTPFLDSLANQSLTFDNMYSAGFHTCNGIFSTLYSYPSALRERPMSTMTINYYQSLPSVFKDYGYENMFFLTSNETFDNVGAFVTQNDFEKIISQKDYNPKYVQSSFGVPDHVMFDYSFEHLHKAKKPFFATFLTISDHGPYIIPKGIDFTPKQKDIKKQIIEYADWSLKQFMKQAQQQSWYKNTIFVFIADHGVVMGDVKYSPPLSLHHIPLIIYAPDTTLVSPNSINNFAIQPDVLPTVAGILNFSYINRTFGIDLLKRERPYSVFSSDDKLCCIDSNYYYVYHKGGREVLYNLKENTPQNRIKEYPQIAEKMKSHLISTMQTTKWLIQNKKTGEK